MSSIQKKHLFFLGICAITALAYRQGFISFGWVNTVASYISYPLLFLENAVASKWHARATEKLSIAQLEERLENLQKQYHHLMAENVSLRVSQKYQSDIYELIDFKQRYNPSFGSIAQVLTKHIGDDAHYFLIGAGSHKGIREDMVVVYKSFLVGKVTDVYPWYSKVTLITDERCKIAAFCEKTNSCGIHEGCNGDDKTALKFVSHLDPIEEGDLVVSSGKGLVFPHGFALGKIKATQQEELFHQIEVEPLINLADLEYVMIIDKGAVESAA